MLTKCKVQEAKFPVKHLVRYRFAEGFNSGVNGLMDNTAAGMMAYLRFLQHYRLGGHTCLRRVVTGGETWHFTPNSKRSTTEQKNSGLPASIPPSPPPPKIDTIYSQNLVGLVAVDDVLPGTWTRNSDKLYAMLIRLRQAVS
jgi:hypothetical protein